MNESTATLKYEFNEKEHVHLLNGKPLTGTSSVEAVMSKPLTWWASGKAVEMLGWVSENIRENGRIVGKVPEKDRLKAAAKVLKKVKKDTVKKYLVRLDEAYRAHHTDSATTKKDGTNLHEELETFVKSRMGLIKKFPAPSERIMPFVKWADENVEKFLWSEAHCFHEDLWVGGVIDAGALLKTGQTAVIDFKRAKEAYVEHFIQASGYALQIERNGIWDKTGTKNKTIGKIDALIVVAFGAKEIKPEIRFDIDAYKRGFEWCVGLYRLLGYEDEISKNNKHNG